jgi:hypothetical protein
MMRKDSSHYRIVAESIGGAREVDDKTLASLSILEERMEKLRKFDEMFSGIEFSSAVKKILEQNKSVPVS